MKLIIDRAKWLRGTADGRLLNEEGKMCCLGFYARSCGYDANDIEAHGEPSEVASERGEDDKSTRWPTWLLEYHDERGCHRATDACNDLIRENDATEITDTDRESSITAIFAKHGVTVEFIG